MEFSEKAFNLHVPYCKGNVLLSAWTTEGNRCNPVEWRKETIKAEVLKNS